MTYRQIEAACERQREQAYPEPAHREPVKVEPLTAQDVLDAATSTDSMLDQLIDALASNLDYARMVFIAIREGNHADAGYVLNAAVRENSERAAKYLNEQQEINA